MTNATKRMSPIRALTYSAICLALALVLPFLTGQIPQIGSALCPMHLPILLCGFLCGPWWAAAAGLIAPLLRHAVFSMPPLLTAIAMAFELCTYGMVSGFLWRKGRRNARHMYLSLIAAMIAGRLVWGAASFVCTGLDANAFGLAAFWAGAFTTARPGIIAQIVIIPVLVMILDRHRR
jgi:predicted membrane protein